MPIITRAHLAQLAPHAAPIADLKTTLVETRLRFEKDQAEQNASVNRIEDGRREGLQRLAKVEQAVTDTKESLTEINSKLNRLFERRR